MAAGNSNSSSSNTSNSNTSNSRTGNPKRSGLGRGLGALITKTDAESATSDARSDASHDTSGGKHSGTLNDSGLDSRDGMGATGQPTDLADQGPGAAEPGTEVEEVPQGVQGTLHVPLSAITPNPHQPRSHFDEGALEELAASVREHGIIQPLIVTLAPTSASTGSSSTSQQFVDPQISSSPASASQLTGSQPRYWLVAGERRWRAAQMAELTEAPVIVREASARELMELALIENIQREDLNPLEEAAAYQALMDEYSLVQNEVADRVGKSRSAVANAVRLLNLSPKAQEALLAKKISSGHARTLLGLIDDDKIDIALEQVISRKLSVRQTEALVKELLEAEEAAFADPRSLAGDDPMESHYRGLEDRFRTALGTKVMLNRNANGTGKLVVHFYNDDDLDSLVQQIAGEEEDLY